MGRARPVERVKLIAGIISSEEELLLKAKWAVERAFRNSVDYEGPVTAFTHTDYYHAEMGHGLKRQFLSFERLLPPENVYALKLKTNALERKFARNGRRRLNIDPGYVTLSKLVLFSTKDYTHRIHLAKGIFAEVTLFYQGGTFKSWPWTYPDYCTKEYIEIFNHIRDIYKRHLAH